MLFTGGWHEGHSGWDNSSIWEESPLNLDYQLAHTFVGYITSVPSCGALRLRLTEGWLGLPQIQLLRADLFLEFLCFPHHPIVLGRQGVKLWQWGWGDRGLGGERWRGGCELMGSCLPKPCLGEEHFIRLGPLAWKHLFPFKSAKRLLPPQNAEIMQWLGKSRRWLWDFKHILVDSRGHEADIGLWGSLPALTPCQIHEKLTPPINFSVSFSHPCSRRAGVLNATCNSSPHIYLWPTGWLLPPGGIEIRALERSKIISGSDSNTKGCCSLIT